MNGLSRMFPTKLPRLLLAQTGLDIKGCPGQEDIFKMAEGHVKIRVCLPYTAGKTSSCNFRDTMTQVIQYIFSTVQIKL